MSYATLELACASPWASTSTAFTLCEPTSTPITKPMMGTTLSRLRRCVRVNVTSEFGRELAAGAHAKLPKRSRQVRLNRLDAQEQLLADRPKLPCVAHFLGSMVSVDMPWFRLRIGRLMT